MAYPVAFVAFLAICGTTLFVIVMFLVPTTPLALLRLVSARALGSSLGFLPFGVLAGLVVRSLLYVDSGHAHVLCHM